MSQKRLYAVFRLPNGQLIRKLVKPEASTSRLERRMVYDIEKKLWIHKTAYADNDKRLRDQAEKNS